MVKKIFHHSRKETQPNTVLEPVKPTTDPHFEESNQSSTIDPRTANVESQIESRLSEERAKAKIADQEAREKRNHRLPESNLIDWNRNHKKFRPRFHLFLPLCLIVEREQS
ncbi:hypothetical protein YC2023_022773 [Brassica napus]